MLCWRLTTGTSWKLFNLFDIIIIIIIIIIVIASSSRYLYIERKSSPTHAKIYVEWKTYLMETNIIANIRYFPSKGTTNDVGGIISTTSKKNTWRLMRIDIDNVTCWKKRIVCIMLEMYCFSMKHQLQPQPRIGSNDASFVLQLKKFIKIAPSNINVMQFFSLSIRLVNRFVVEFRDIYAHTDHGRNLVWQSILCLCFWHKTDYCITNYLISILHVRYKYNCIDVYRDVQSVLFQQNLLHGQCNFQI